jgi:hypothetical protein
MQTKWDFTGSTDMWSTSAGGHLMKVVNLTGFTVYENISLFVYFCLLAKRLSLILLMLIYLFLCLIANIRIEGDL